MSLSETETVWRSELIRPSALQRHGYKSDILRAYASCRDLLERAIGCLLLILSAPLMLVLIVAIRVTSKGPGVYSQKRVGLGGRIYTMYKLRSMRCDAEVRTGPVWASAGQDPRITPLGAWLRHLHLDELPQFYNVACGDMALVGPRPERPEFVSLLAEHIPDYLERLRVKPGITGLAQINLPADTDLQSVRRKLILDQEYIRTTGMILDARIMLCTILRVFGLRGGRAVSLLGLSRIVELPPSTPVATPSPPVASGVRLAVDAAHNDSAPLASASPLATART